MPSDPHNKHEEYRNKLLGLGETSLRKNYYSELRKHMRELEESRTRYETIFNATADALFIHDAETYNVIDINIRACNMFGYSREEFLESEFKDICIEEEPYTYEHAYKHLKNAQTSGVQNFEWKTRNKNGENLWCDVILKSATIDGKTCVIASVRDISSRKLLEDQLMHSQKMEAMGQLAGGVAHDFNNMLAGIIGAAEIIHSTTEDVKLVRKMAEMILNAAETAGNLTTQLLSFSRKGSFEEHPIHIHSAISNAANILERSFAKNIEVILELNAGCDIISGDLSLIENIIINMSINARDSMPKGGRLIIHTDEIQTSDLRPEHSFDTDAESLICIHVSDTGHGIPDEIRQHIFEPFFTTKETGKGTGLGLAAVYGAVQRHNGNIELESTMGEGSTFTIYLPLLPEESRPQKASQDSEIHGTGKILLIDDEEVIRFIGENVLGSLGYDVITAEDGIEGIEKFKTVNPDIVLLDMVMPKMNSIDCFHELKKINPDIPVIAVSGFTPDVTIENLFKEGLAGFMKKPYKTKAMSEKLAEILANRRS